MGRRLNHATPTVVNTELIPFDESFFIGAEGQLEQWYYDNTTQYAPNRRLSPLILTPHLSIFDKETGDSYSSDAESASTSYVAFYTVMWYALEYVNDGYVESVITNLTDSADADYVISGNSLIVKKNVSYSHGVTIRCVATYKDPRDTNNAYTTQETVLLTTNRDAKVDLPEVSIISPSARGFNPLTDYKTVDGVEVQDSLFDFEAVVSNKPTVDPGVQYRVDGGGTEEIVEEEGVMTALPSMDIRYPDSDVMLDQSFLYRVTANGTKPNVNGGAFVTALRGNTVKFEQLVQNPMDSYTRSSEGVTYIINSTHTFLASHRAYVRADVKKTSDFSAGTQRLSLCKSGNMYGGHFSIVSSVVPVDNTYHRVSTVLTSADSRNASLGLQLTGTVVGSVSVKNVVCVDLTELFGSDAQIAAALGITTADITTATGIAAFESWMEQNLGKRNYYPYDAGSLVPTRFEAVKTVSFNIWDGTYSATDKYIDVNGDLARSYSGLSVTNFIKVLPDTDYYISIKSGAAGPSVCFYDESYQYISGITHTSIPSSKIFHTPVSTCYIKTTVTSTPPCINISIPSKNGTSGQHWESTAPLPITSLMGERDGMSTGRRSVVFPDGMKRVGNVYDEIKVENGVLKAIKRVGSVDLGTLSWYATGTSCVYRSSDISNLKTNRATSGFNAKMLCVKYDVSERGVFASSITDKTIGNDLNGTPQIIAKDTDYTTAANFKTAMSGVILYFELATPQEYVLDPIQEPFIFEWFGISGNQEVKADTLPWYVSGQGTSRLTVDAMFGEHINVVAAAKMLSGQLSPSRAYAAVTWRIPDVDTHVMSAKGGTVRNESDSFTFETICNVKGQMLSENVKNEHLRFNWKYRRSDSTTENDAGWGQSVILSSANLINVRTVAGKLPSTHVYPYPFLLGAWEPQTSTDPVPYSQPTLVKDGITYVRTIN